ncbi:MAG TPA: CRISPR-associated endonuclease Cas2 [Candidatus Paceibacterota bacterium]
MGRLEQESRSRARRNQLRNAVLVSVKVAGLLAIAAVVPNAVSGLHKLGLLPGSRHAETIRRSYRRLIHTGHLEFDGRYLRLTTKGERELRMYEIRGYKLPKPRKWDKKWRVLVFDIPERRKVLREKVRRTLQHIGFERLQDSVWAYPYDCEDLITLLKADFKIGYDVLYMIVDQLEGDQRLKKHFKLK